MMIASRMEWSPGADRSLLRYAAEEMLEQGRHYPEADPRDLVAAHAHLAEVHIGIGEQAAARKHYRFALDLIRSIKGTAVDLAAQCTLDLAWTTSVAAFDVETGRRYHAADSFLDELIPEIDAQLTACESAGHPCGLSRIRWTYLRLLHATHHGRTDQVSALIDEIRHRRSTCQESIPEIINNFIDNAETCLDFAGKVFLFRQLIGSDHVILQPDPSRGSVKTCVHFRDEAGSNLPDSDYSATEDATWDAQQVWNAAWVHAELLRSWLHDQEASLNEATLKVWGHPALREAHIAGALQILGLLLRTLAGSTSPETIRDQVCDHLHGVLGQLNDEHGVSVSAAQTLLAAFRSDGGIVNIDPPQHIIDVQHLLWSLLTAEKALITKVVADRETSAAKIVEWLRKATEFEAKRLSAPGVEN